MASSSSLPIKSQRSTADHSLSCAECRRLKLKCSRQQWPCDTCVKRGIAHLCPNGVQQKEKGNHSASTSTKVPTLAKTIAGSSNTSLTSHGSSQLLGDQAILNRLERLEKKIDKLIVASSAGTPSTERLALGFNGSLHELATIATNDFAPGNDEQSASPQDDEARRQHGTLTMLPDGRAHYIGSNAQSVYLAHDKVDDRKVSFREDLLSRPGSPTPVDLEAATHMSNVARDKVESIPGASPEGNTPSTIESQPAQLVWATPGFRSPHSSTAIWNHLKPVLPVKETALRMINVYYATVTFMFHPITRFDFDTSIWNVFYSESSLATSYSTPVNFHPHKLALLYSMLSVGVLMDVQRPQRDPVGRALYSCAWNCLAMSNFTEATSLEAILALMHINMYLTWRRGGRYAESAYPLLGTMMRMAISTGLHRDPSLFNLDEAQEEKRRRVFWDIQCSDVFRAFAFCRPPALCDRHVDTILPKEWQTPSNYGEDDDSLSLLPSRREGLFHHFKCRQIQIINRMLDECLCVRPTYQVTVKFDESLRILYKKMSKWMMPVLVDFDARSKFADKDLEEAYSNMSTRNDMILEMQQHTTLLNHHQALLLLHRSWFSRALFARDQAIITSPQFTLSEIQDQSPIFKSITAVNESASAMISIIVSIWCKYPALVIRWAFFWNAVFSAAVCRGLYVLKCRHYKTDEIEKAWLDLQRAITLFDKAVIGWLPLETPLAILQRLYKRAQIVINGEEEEKEPKGLVVAQTSQDHIDDEEEEVDLIGDERELKMSKRLLKSSHESGKRRKRSSSVQQQQYSMDHQIETVAGQQQNHDMFTNVIAVPSEAADALLLPLPTFDFSSQMIQDTTLPAIFAIQSPVLNTSVLPPLFGNNTTGIDSTSGSASASQLIQMLSNGLSWDDVSSWNELIVDL